MNGEFILIFFVKTPSLHMVEKWIKKDFKKGLFNHRMEFRKKSIMSDIDSITLHFS
jgi:hypothetical protein